MTKVLVTGGHGQLGMSLSKKGANFSDIELVLKNAEGLDIRDSDSLKVFFSKNSFDFCINCAAYTAVDLAEDESEKTYNVNALGAKNLAKICSENDVTLIQISTDFVFDGQKACAYTEKDDTKPLSVYGASKLKGEKWIKENCREHFIIRTSWLYSEFGKNFMKTMLRLSGEKETITVVDDQIGTPTYALDLAEAILTMIKQNSNQYGIYHYSNEGVASWYDFAKAIFNLTQKKIKTVPVKSKSIKAKAIRPLFSVLDKNKFKDTFSMQIPYWRDSLEKALNNFHEN